jgi:hypothetical protein
LTAKNSPADYFNQPGRGSPRPRASRNVRPSCSGWYQSVRGIDRTKRGLSPRRAGRSPPQPPLLRVFCRREPKVWRMQWFSTKVRKGQEPKTAVPAGWAASPSSDCQKLQSFDAVRA